VSITWVKGHAGIPSNENASIPGNERVDALAGNAAEKAGVGIPVAYLAYLKLRISERFRKAKETWHANPAHHGTEGNPHRHQRSPALITGGAPWLAQLRRFAQDIGGQRCISSRFGRGETTGAGSAAVRIR
jgi:hypothetical protein